MKITAYSIERVYAHRIAADPKTCPVCCGDCETDDPQFGRTVTRLIDEGTHNERRIFKCEACEVWATPEGA